MSRAQWTCSQAGRIYKNSLRLCVISDCAHFFLEFSSGDFEENSGGELLVASEYELITGMSIEKSYAGVQNSYLSISIILFFSWIPIFKRKFSCPEPENPSFPARKIQRICASLSPFQQNLPPQSSSQDRIIQYFISWDFSLIEGNKFVLEFGFGFGLLWGFFLVEQPSFRQRGNVKKRNKVRKLHSLK